MARFSRERAIAAGLVCIRGGVYVNARKDYRDAPISAWKTTTLNKTVCGRYIGKAWLGKWGYEIVRAQGKNYAIEPGRFARMNPRVR